MKSSVCICLCTDTEGWSVCACVRCVWISPQKSLRQSLGEELAHACGSTRTHTMLTYAGKDTAERECGIVKGSGAGGWQLFGLFIFDLHWPRTTQRPLDRRRLWLYRFSSPKWNKWLFRRRELRSHAFKAHCLIQEIGPSGVKWYTMSVALSQTLRCHWLWWEC